MYESYYGFSENPFRIAPDPAFFYASAGHKRAQAYLRYGVYQGQGFVVITGASGTGKSLLLQTMLQELPSEEYVVARISNTNLQADDILRAVVESFGIRERLANKAELLSALEAFLKSHASLGRNTILVVDEAQNLPRRSLEELRMLSNFQLNEKPMLQIVLIGQEQFRETLADKNMEQLTQRIIAASNLLPITAMETRGYIGHRLSHAGWQGNPRFTGEALRWLFLYTRGVPRMINVFCDRLLLASALDERSEINEALVQKVVSELSGEPGGLWSSEFIDPDAAGVDKLPALPEENVIPNPARSVASPPQLDDDVPAFTARPSHSPGQKRPQPVAGASPMPPQASPPSGVAAPRRAASVAVDRRARAAQARVTGQGVRSAPLSEAVRESQLSKAERVAESQAYNDEDATEATPPAKIIELPISRTGMAEKAEHQFIDDLLAHEDFAGAKAPDKLRKWRIVLIVLLLAVVGMVSSVGTYFFLLRDSGVS